MIEKPLRTLHHDHDEKAKAQRHDRHLGAEVAVVDDEPGLGSHPARRRLTARFDVDGSREDAVVAHGARRYGIVITAWVRLRVPRCVPSARTLVP